MKTRKELIVDNILDLASELMYYGRKEDEELPRGEIEKALEGEEITVTEMVNLFEKALRAYTGHKYE